MKTNHTTSLLIAVILSLAPQAYAAPMLRTFDQGLPTIAIEVDCYALGQDKAAELGGELAKAEPATADGAPVCHVVVLVPGKDGARPKRVALDIPQ